MFFADGAATSTTSGMSLGGDKFIHAPRTGDVVKIRAWTSRTSRSTSRAAGVRRLRAGGADLRPRWPRGARVDPTAVAKAQAAVARDAAEVRRNDSLLFKAVTKQEAPRSRRRVQFLKAITPEQAAAAKAAAAPAPAAARRARRRRRRPLRRGRRGQAARADLSAVDTDYPGDDASQAELAKWLGKQAEKAGLPAELPVMAALVESNVKNLNYGHADSVGFFQMRVGIWNQGEYAGYPERPELQAKWFIDTALAVKKDRIADGDVDFGKDPSAVGRVDRRRRAPRRGVPRPLPAAARRGAQAPRLRLSPRRRR